MKRAVINSIDICDGKSNLNYPKLVRLTSSDELLPDVKFAAFRSKVTNQLTMSATTGGFHYLSSAPPRSLYFAAVDRNSGECRLSSLQSFSLAPVTAASSASQANSAPGDADNAKTGSFKHALDAFGLLRSKRKMERRERFKVTDQQLVVGEALQLLQKETELDPAGTPVSGPVCEAAETELLTPPCNWQAKAVDEAYSRDDVIPQPVWNCLLEQRDDFLVKLAEADESCSIARYIRLQLSKLTVVVGPCNDETDARQPLIIYAFYLLRLLRHLQKRSLVRKWGCLGIPEAILAHMRTSFMERSVHGWDRSERLKDKLVCHFLVVAMWIHRYTIDLDVVTAATGISLANLMRYAAHLGMKMKKHTAELRVPLVKSTPGRRSFRAQRSIAAL